MSPPILAVVIPTLNEEGTIACCLDSIGADDGVEVAVSDGGSVDGTVEAVRASGRARLLQGPAGRGRQLRRGAAATSAPRLLFLHADCRLPDGWLRVVVDALEDPRTALACFRLVTEPTGPGASLLRRVWLRLLDVRSFGLGLPYGDQGFAMRRAVGWLELEPLYDLDTDADLRRALEEGSEGGELRSQLRAAVGEAGRSSGP